MADGDRVQALVESWAELPELASQDDFLFVPEQGLNDEKQDWEVKEEAVKKNSSVIEMSLKCFETLGAIPSSEVVEGAVGKFLCQRNVQVEDGKVHAQASALKAMAQEVVRQAKKTMAVRKGRQWLKPLKAACGPQLLAKKFKRKSQGGNGSPADQAETQPMAAGDIPDPKCPPLHVVDKVVGQLDKRPPQAFDPRLQHKKQFRALVKGQPPEGEESNEAQQAKQEDANPPVQMAEEAAASAGSGKERGVDQGPDTQAGQADREGGDDLQAEEQPEGGQADREGGDDLQAKEQPEVPDETREAKSKSVYQPGILQTAYAKLLKHAKELGVNRKDALNMWKTSRVRMAILEDVDDKERKKRRFG